MALFLLLLPLLSSLLCSAFAAPLPHLITSLPGQPQVSFKQYSGYITIDPQAGRRFFYYLVEAEEDPSSKPLTLWLNGGPGCSSVGLGAFTENGPFRVGNAKGTLHLNPYAWTQASNVLYLDSPAGVGWSYTNRSSDLTTNDTLTAQDNFKFLQNWFEAFPEYKTREFFITGESYAGHYAPQLAALVVAHNREAGKTVFNLKGMAVGNPILNGLIDFPQGVFFQWSHGLISDETYSAVISSCNFSIFAQPNDACDTSYGELQREVSDFTSPYDVLVDVCLPSAMHQAQRIKQLMNPTSSAQLDMGVDVCIDDELGPYMNLPEVQQAFHANTTGLHYAWTYCSHKRITYGQSNIDNSILPILAHLLEAGVRVLVYSGDQDTVLPFSGSRTQIHDLAKLMKLKTTVQYSAWYESGQVGGWTQGYGNLTFATVRGAAHTVPNSSPARALLLFKSFLNGEPLPINNE